MGGPSALRAGVAIDLKQSQGNQNNYDFIDNFTSRTLQYLGVVLNDLITDLYDDEMSVFVQKDEKREEILLNQEGGVNLSEGEFEVKVSIGSATESKRRQSNELMIQLLEKLPAMQNAGHIIAKNLDNMKDQDELVKILKASLPPEILSISEADEQTVMLENGQLKGELEHITAQYEQALEFIKSMQIDYQKAMDVQKLKNEGDIEKELIKSDTALTKQEMDNENNIVQELIKHINLLNGKVEDLTAKVNGETVSINTGE